MTATIDEPRIVEFPALKDAKAKLNAKRDSLAAVLAEAGPEYDMGKIKSLAGDSQAKVEAIRALNEELDDLGSKVAELTVVAKAAGAAAQAEEQRESGADENNDGRVPNARNASIGDLFVASQACKGFTRGNGQGPSAHLDINLKNALFSTTAGFAPETTRTGHLEWYATRPAPDVVEFIPQTTTGQAAVVYMEETTFTNAAAETAEADPYAEATLALTEKSSSVRKIAVFLPVTDEQFEDEPRARDYVNNRLPFMVRQRLDLQILSGNGTAPNLRGTENVVGINSQALGGDSVPDAIYKGMRLIREVGFAEPNVVFIRPSKWETVRLSTTTDGIYLWGSPAMAGPMTIWGVPVKETTAAPATKALIGDYANFSELAVRRGIDVQVSNSHSDYFVNGKLAIRADVRMALIHYRPTAFAAVTGL